MKVDCLKPTPIGCTLELIGIIKALKGRKVVVDVSLYAVNEVCAKGEVIVVQIPDNWNPK